jgi:hypothetical protein
MSTEPACLSEAPATRLTFINKVTRLADTGREALTDCRRALPELIKINALDGKQRPNQPVKSTRPSLLFPRCARRNAMDKYQQSQKNKLFKTQAHDPYCLQRVEGAAMCPQCDAVYEAGNWHWNRAENTGVHNAQSVTCPACRRIAENAPAGTVTLSGSFLRKHYDEIIHLIKNTEKMEATEHALERIIHLTDSEDDLVVTTTGIHLANRLGHALEAAFKGKAQYRYGDTQYGLSVTWTRNE